MQNKNTRRVARIIQKDPCFTCFKPACGANQSKSSIKILVDEYEAMRLCDLENLTMQQWAKKMGVSAPTFNRMVKSAHRKIADALVYGKEIRIYTCNEKIWDPYEEF